MSTAIDKGSSAVQALCSWVLQSICGLSTGCTESCRPPSSHSTRGANALAPIANYSNSALYVSCWPEPAPG